MARPRLHDDALRTRLLEHAGRIVSEAGVGSLTLRGLAAAAGTSTTAVYALFGGKADLLEALWRASFDGFGRSQNEVPQSVDVLADLHALGLAYRSWALANPDLYGVMFGGTLVGFTLEAAAEAESRATMRPLQSVITRGIEAGLLGHADAETMAFAIWAGVHGLVSLELTTDIRRLPRARRDATYDAALRGIARSWQLAGPG
ncbi:MAG TPA: TetR/AcrR family transcriptional regulator [Mycobacteriales bacterium]|nr:TetR/AcrR family transcriptional regulator [Mycobacteriales bacterium]